MEGHNEGKEEGQMRKRGIKDGGGNTRRKIRARKKGEERTRKAKQPKKERKEKKGKYIE